MIWIIPAALVTAIIFKAWKWYKREIKDFVDKEHEDDDLTIDELIN